MNNPSPWINKEIKGYRILEKLRSGYVSITFKAIRISDNKTVALKLLASDLNDLGPEARKRFEREIKILSTIQHPHILTLKDHGDYEGNPYLVTDFMDGGNLRQYLDKFRNGLDIEDVLKLFGPIAEAVDYAHQRGITHRDLKPQNVVLQETSNEAIPYLTDFGIATIKDGTRYTTTSMYSPGTPPYMAPEMWKAGEKNSYKLDIYALGVMLYEALEGKVPFEGTGPELGDLHKNHIIPYPHETAKRTNRQVVKVLFRALAKDPKNRYESASELIHQLETAYQTGQQQRREELQKRIMVWAAVAAVFATLIGAVISSNWFSNWWYAFFSPAPIALTQTKTITMTSFSTPANIVTLTTAPPESSTTPAILPTFSPVVLGKTIGNLVWLRAGPGENYHALATYSKGIIVTILGKSDDGNWLVVLLPDGRQGWVSSASIEPNVSIPDLPVATAPATETPQPTLPPGAKRIPLPGTKYPIGDLNHDCVVNSADTAIVQSHYGESGGASDLNGDGIVNIVDIGIVTDHMGQTCS